MIQALNPFIPMEQVEELARCCNAHNMGALHLLDVGTSLLAVELLTLETGEDGLILDAHLLEEACNVAKIIGRFLRQECVTNEQRLLSILLILKAMVVNMLGGCGKKLYS